MKPPVKSFGKSSWKAQFFGRKLTPYSFLARLSEQCEGLYGGEHEHSASRSTVQRETVVEETRLQHRGCPDVSTGDRSCHLRLFGRQCGSFETVRPGRRKPVGLSLGTSYEISISESDQCFNAKLSRLEGG